jgi:hypothetical protein
MPEMEHGARINDRTAILFGRLTRQQEGRPFEDDSQEAVPGSFGQLLQQTSLIDSRVADQDV